MSYLIKISKQALKDLEDLPLRANRVVSASIDNLSVTPRPAGCKKLKGEKEILWRIRSGDYRIIYSIEDEIRIIQIRKVGHRKNIYD
jgi:mRNA interferase RelE/StbE